VIYDGWGNVEARGKFNAGKKEGLWSYFDSRGNRLVEISWRGGLKDGKCRMWYGRSMDGGKWLGNRKVEMSFAADLPDGMKHAWYPSGGKRAEVAYEKGAVRNARLWAPTGEESSPAQAVRQAEEDWIADQKLFGALEQEVQDGLANSGQKSSAP
jgi:antitoxin component YwqK of YwqJK toxin-antitoxin module